MTLIASILHLDRTAIKALRITDLYSLHRVVYSLYPDVRTDEGKLGGDRSGILFADIGGDSGERRILLLADRAPADCVDRQYGQVQSKPIPDRFLDNIQYQFNVTINPTRRDSASGKLTPIKGRQAISQWFCERAALSWGFVVSAEHLQIDRIDVQQFKAKNDHQITLGRAFLHGRLTVTDAEKFRRSFSQGLGRGRTFGCGLLQIIPIFNDSVS